MNRNAKLLFIMFFTHVHMAKDSMKIHLEIANYHATPGYLVSNHNTVNSGLA